MHDGSSDGSTRGEVEGVRPRAAGARESEPREPRDARGAGADPWVGRLVAEKLRIVRPISGRAGCAGRDDAAGGARGTLYEAENTQTLRRVEVRLLEVGDLRSRSRVRRFVREARAGARLHHPNVVDVFDLGEDARTGALFVVQEALRGVSLDALLEERAAGSTPLSAAECVGVALPIAEALEAAHQLGLVHGELTTASVFLAQRGGITVPKLIDFGLGARIEGAPARVPATPRDDVRALGALLGACASASALLGACASASESPAELVAIAARAAAQPGAGGFETMTALVRALRATAAWARRAEAGGQLTILAGGTSSLPPPPRLDWPVIERLAWAPAASALPADALPTPSGRRPLRAGRTRFGLVLAGRGAPLREAVKGISKAVRGDVAVIGYESYARLVDALAEGVVDLAWLPPVAYVRARRAGAARLLLTVERDGSRSYSSAILARAELPARGVRELRQVRAAWVDPWSAAGFLIPRRMLRGAGLEPEARFRTQTFLGSYERVLRALVDDEADVGAARCRLGPSGDVTHGAFVDDPRVRILALSRDPIPGDAICASPTLDLEACRDAAGRFVRAASSPELAPCFRAILGDDRLVAANPSRYERLELALEEDLHPLAEPDPETRAHAPADEPRLAVTAAWEAVG